MTLKAFNLDEEYITEKCYFCGVDVSFKMVFPLLYFGQCPQCGRYLATGARTTLETCPEEYKPKGKIEKQIKEWEAKGQYHKDKFAILSNSTHIAFKINELEEALNRYCQKNGILIKIFSKGKQQKSGAFMKGDFLIPFSIEHVSKVYQILSIGIAVGLKKGVKPSPKKVKEAAEFSFSLHNGIQKELSDYSHEIGLKVNWVRDKSSIVNPNPAAWGFSKTKDIERASQDIDFEQIHKIEDARLMRAAKTFNKLLEDTNLHLDIKNPFQSYDISDKVITSKGYVSKEFKKRLADSSHKFEAFCFDFKKIVELETRRDTLSRNVEKELSSSVSLEPKELSFEVENFLTHVYSFLDIFSKFIGFFFNFKQPRKMEKLRNSLKNDNAPSHLKRLSKKLLPLIDKNINDMAKVRKMRDTITHDSPIYDVKNSIYCKEIIDKLSDSVEKIIEEIYSEIFPKIKKRRVK